MKGMSGDEHISGGRNDMTKDEILGKRSYSRELGLSAGNAVGEICNAALADDRPIEWRLRRLDECIRVFNGEVREMQEIIRECKNHFTKTP
jgi:hypothetical protein